MARLVDASSDPQGAIAAAVPLLARGGLVVFPTETFYGLAGAPLDAAAMERLATLKERERKPIPLIAASWADVERLGAVPELLAPACRALWPGSLTVALTPELTLPAALLAGGTTVAVRISSHPLAQALAAAAGGLVSSTSANLAGRPPVRSAAELDPELLGRVDLVLDGGLCPGGAPSTVLGVQGGRPVLLRAGAVPVEVLERHLGQAVERPR